MHIARSMTLLAWRPHSFKPQAVTHAAQHDALCSTSVAAAAAAALAHC
jgi:hypothetical protein